MKQKPENAAAKSICQMAKTINDQNTPEIKTKKRLVQLTDRLKNFTQACSNEFNFMDSQLLAWVSKLFSYYSFSLVYSPLCLSNFQQISNTWLCN